MKIVKVDWLDICSATTHWTPLAEIDLGPLKCVSVGVLIKETTEYISIAQNYNEEEDLVSDTMTFPKKVVTNVVELGHVGREV